MCVWSLGGLILTVNTDPITAWDFRSDTGEGGGVRSGADLKHPPTARQSHTQLHLNTSLFICYSEHIKACSMSSQYSKAFNSALKDQIGSVLPSYQVFSTVLYTAGCWFRNSLLSCRREFHPPDADVKAKQASVFQGKLSTKPPAVPTLMWNKLFSLRNNHANLNVLTAFFTH